MHSGFMQFAAFDQDAVDNKDLLSKANLPFRCSLWVAKNPSERLAQVMRFAASNVQKGVVPDSGHRVMEENPNATITMVRSFLMAG